ncbi:MAG TPA: PAS domain S-box protein, partial [Coleofasciculaceae cyanobacterium]
VVEYPSGAVRFEYVSPAFEEIHEASVAQVYQDATIPFHQMHPDDRASYQQAVAQALDTMQTFRHEWRIITPSGKLKWIQANSRPERRDNGEVVWHGVVQDISDYKAAEIALQAKTEELDRFFSTALDLLCIANTNGYFLRLNPQWEKTLGYRLEDLEGVKFLDFVHPEDLESTLNAIALLAKQQEVPNFMNRYRCRDGSYRWIEWRSVPVGQLIYAAARDVSDRKYAEEALKNSERKFKGAFNTLAVGMCLVSIAGGFLEVNSALCQLLGYSESELLSIRWQDIVYPEDQFQELEWVEQMYAGKQVGYQLEQRFLRQDGTVLWGLSSISLMRGPQQEPLYLIAQVTDINERKQSEIALQSAKEIAETANRSKSVFLANMSHELRTPLNGILGYAQILQRDKNFTPKQKEGLGIIQQCGEHLLTLINDILDLSKIEADKLELHPGDFNFPAFLQGIFEIFRFKAVRKSIHFTYLTTQQLPTTVRADEKRLRQILMNLLSNAIKFTDTGTVIFKVEVISDKSLNLGNSEQKKYPIPNSQFPIFKIRFQVDDTGIGITPEHLEKIFLPFEQVGDSSRYTEGTGLGLAITQKLIGLMGSQIFVESIPNVGSKFWFDLDLPVITNSIELTPIKPACNIIGYQGKKRKILVVDDRWENCAVLINLLEPLGFELFEAANGKEGLEKAIEVQPDLIFVDLVMPVMDGHEMTRKLRQLPLFQSTIIIAISANAFETDRLLSLKSGCNNFFPKPLQTEALLDKIKSYLNLTWIYDGDNTGNGKGLSTSIVDSTLSQMVIPPPEELLALSQAAQIGDVSEVEQEINRLQQLNPEYTSFVTKIVKLAEEFEYEKIVNLVDGYFKPDSAP